MAGCASRGKKRSRTASAVPTAITEPNFVARAQRSLTATVFLWDRKCRARFAIRGRRISRAERAAHQPRLHRAVQRISDAAADQWPNTRSARSSRSLEQQLCRPATPQLIVRQRHTRRSPMPSRGGEEEDAAHPVEEDRTRTDGTEVAHRAPGGGALADLTPARRAEAESSTTRGGDTSVDRGSGPTMLRIHCGSGYGQSAAASSTDPSADCGSG